MHNGIDAFEVDATTWEGDRGEVQTLMWIDIGENKLKLPDCTPEKVRNILEFTGLPAAADQGRGRWAPPR
jgi:hypothetical protein